MTREELDRLIDFWNPREHGGDAAMLARLMKKAMKVYDETVSAHPGGLADRDCPRCIAVSAFDAALSREESGGGGR